MATWIDMCREMNILMHGGYGSIGQAYWVVLRIFRHGERSQYWNEGVDEAIGGPEFRYDDHVVKTISYPASKYTQLTEKTTGGISDIAQGFYSDKDTYIFAIEFNQAFARIPAEKDLIYQIDKYEGPVVPVPPYTATARFKIIQVFPDYGDNGRIEMIYCIGEKSHGES